MKKSSLIVASYAILVLIGGIIGHIKAGSKASLISGITFGVLLLLLSLAMYKEKRYGYYLALGLAFFLDAFFTYRFTLTHAFFPSGMMSLLSLFVAVLLLFRHKKKAKAV